MQDKLLDLYRLSGQLIKEYEEENKDELKKRESCWAAIEVFTVMIAIENHLNEPNGDTYY